MRKEKQGRLSSRCPTGPLVPLAGIASRLNGSGRYFCAVDTATVLVGSLLFRERCGAWLGFSTARPQAENERLDTGALASLFVRYCALCGIFVRVHSF